MVKLTSIRPRVQPLQARGPASVRSGDERIRGSALRSIRERILSRDCGVCQCARCKATGDTRPATIVDHIVPLWAGGREDDSNRQAINAECHDAKSAHEARCRARGSFDAWQG